MASNCVEASPLKRVQQWSQAERKDIEIDQPYLTAQYNKNIGRVDQMDHNIGKLRPAIRMKKWWWPLFLWLLVVSMQNAWLLYRNVANEQLIGGTELDNSFEKSCLCIRLQETLCHNSFKSSFEKSCRSQKVFVTHLSVGNCVKVRTRKQGLAIHEYQFWTAAKQ